jgi:hypothetical protein
MRPDSFHLTVGMPRAEAMQALEAWNPKKGSSDDEIVVDYSDERALTLSFRNDRLHSLRFELFLFLPEVRSAFEEAGTYLRETFGEPKTATGAILVYDQTLPNIMVVAGDDPTSSQGKQGIGVLAIRYYDPR